MSEEELSYILQHEFYHIRRKDYLTKLLAFVLTAIYWFNPLVWVAYFLFNRDMEMSCDEKVLLKLGGAVKKDYSSLLLAFATNKRMGFGVLAFGEGDISKRVKNVLNFKKPKFWIGIAGIVLVIVLAVCCLTNAKEDEAPVVMPTGKTVYKMVTENEDLFWTPGITLDSDEGTFSFGYSMLSSYINYGSYEIQGDKLVAKTSDGQYYFTFQVIDEETLEFVEKESSKLHQFEDEKEFWVKDGAIFKYEEVKGLSVNQETTGEDQHLQFFEDFEWINQNGGMNGFMLSEKVVDGEVFYCLKENVENVEILVDAECKLARVITESLDKTIELPARVHFGGTNDGGYFHLLDATGDGVDELIYVYGGGGTGFWDGGIDIYNLEDMTKYVIEDKDTLIKLLKTQISFEPIFMDSKNTAVCKMTMPDESVQYVLVQAAKEDKEYSPKDFEINYNVSGYVNYDVYSSQENNKVSVSIGIDMPSVCMPGTYLGNITGTLVFDNKRGMFCLDDSVEWEVSSFDDVVAFEESYMELSLLDSEWIINFTNKMKSTDINYLYNISLQKQNETGAWENVETTHLICGMMDPLKAGETVGIAMRKEWFPDLDAGNYRMGVTYCIVQDGILSEQMWHWENVKLYK